MGKRAPKCSVTFRNSASLQSRSRAVHDRGDVLDGFSGLVRGGAVVEDVAHPHDDIVR